MAEENQTSKTNQTVKFPKPSGEFTIRDLETLKVMTDPLRLRIIELLMEQPRNVKFLASALNISSTKLYYHINMLEEKGILKVVSTRVVSGIIEKLYQPVAENFLVDRNLLQNEGEDGKEGLLNSFSALLDATKDKIFESVRHGVISTNGETDEKKASLSFFSSGSRISRKRAAEFHDRLEKLILEFNAWDEEAGEAGEELRSYAITIAFFPTVEATSSNSESEE